MYTCGSKTFAVFNSTKETIVTFPLPCGRVCDGPHQCPQCTKKREDTILDNILIEQRERGNLLWARVADVDIASICKNLSRYKTPFYKLPQVDGTVVIIFSEQNKLWPIGGRPLPRDEDSLKAFVSRIAGTPKGKKLDPSKIKHNGDGNVIPGFGQTLKGIEWAREQKQAKEENPEAIKSAVVWMPPNYLHKRMEKAGAQLDWPWHGYSDGESVGHKASPELQEKILLSLLLDDLVPDLEVK